MADKKPTPNPQPDPIAPVVETPIDKPAGEAVFKPDEFLASKKVKANDIKAPSGTTDSATKFTSAPQVIKRGGVSFFTALAMSTLATGAGAYLALFVQARPDVLQKAGIGALLPLAAPASGGDVTGSNLQPLVQRVTALEAQLQALQTKVAALGPQATEGQTSKLGASPAPLPASPPVSSTEASAQNPATPLPSNSPSGTVIADVGLLKSELGGIGGRVTAIETRLAALDPTGSGGAVIAGLQADIAGLKSMITALQQQVASAPSPAVTMAVVNLAEAAGRSGPFMTEFETLRSAMGNGPEVAALEAYARTGVPTRTVLQERFAALGPAITAAANTAQKEGGLVLWFRSLFADMIKVTPAPDANGKAADDVLLRAKTKLDQGDLSGSVDDMATLANAPAPVGEWIALARKRLDLESRLSAVRGVATRAPVPPTQPAQPAASAILALPTAITSPRAIPALAPPAAPSQITPTQPQGTNP